jgi:glucose/arabinose dehydrogenase/cytochrome c5
MLTRYLTVAARLAVAGAILSIATACGEKPPASSAASASAAPRSCDPENGGITLPPGFCATIFADNIGHARHLVVAPNGVVYANTWSGEYYGNDKPPLGGFLVAMQDTKSTGHADVITRFGGGVPEGSHGGTGIGIYQNHLYAEINDRIVRYPLGSSGVDTAGKPEVIVSGLPVTGDHPMHPFIIDAKGNLFTDLGSATNACEVKNRMPLSPGNKPCTEKLTRAGTWKYDANKLDQKFSPAERYATGIRNGEGFAIDAAGRLFVSQHGRDQLSENWSKLYPVTAGPELPAEEVVELKQGADYGWPECYFDPRQNKLVLAPEYGGDGGKTVGLCADRSPPAAAFPAHWAPNALLVLTGKGLPKAYSQGMFIAFHGSWNRAPAPQAGYNITFQPMAEGKAAGAHVTFADGFAGAVKEPGRAAFRPSGLVEGPDGSIYISDDVHGRIWRVTYSGSTDAPIAAAPAPAGPAASASVATAALQVAPGATAAQLALGDSIFHGQVANATCAGCHGSDGKGSPIGADLTAGTWLWSDGSVASLSKTISKGVPKPKAHGGAMPPMGGTPLKPAELKAVSVYVWGLGHRAK